jgi:hypothetical protein
MDETPDSEDLLGFLAEEGRHRRDPDDHPSVETLTAYHANELSAEEDSRIQDHLLICRHCTELLLDLEEFLRPAEGQKPPAVDFEQAADWRRLREELPALVSQRQTEPVQNNERLLRSLRTFKVLAAALLAVTVGLTANALLQRRGFEILPYETLDLTTPRTEESSEAPLEIHLPYPLPYITSGGYERYRLDILDEDKHVKKSKETEFASGIVSLKESTLAPGQYMVEMYGLREGKAKLIGNRSILVKP